MHLLTSMSAMRSGLQELFGLPVCEFHVKGLSGNAGYQFP